MSSNNSGLSNATNGRTNANNNKSISHKNSNAPPLPERPAAAAKLPHNNDSSSGGGSSSSNHTVSATAASTHRRDNSSSVSGCHVPGNRNSRDSRKFRYVKPQVAMAHLPAQLQQLEDGDGESPSPEHSSIAESDKEHLLVYYEGHLMSGTLEVLIQHMVPTNVYYPERQYTFAFLLSARLFVRPHELLAQISQTWERQQQTSAADVVDEAPQSRPHIAPLVVASASPLTLRKANAEPLPQTLIEAQRQQRSATQLSAQNCIRLLAEWIETFPYDFRDERLMQQVRILARKCVYIDNALGKQVSRILQLLVQRLTALEKYEEFLQTLTSADMNATSQQQQHYSTSASAAFAATNAAVSTASASAAAAAASDFHNPLAKSNHSHSHSANAALHIETTSGGAAVSNATPSGEAIGELQSLDIIEMCTSCAKLAHQLTAIELERLSHIGPEEFVQTFAKEYQSSGSGSSGSSSGSSIMSSSLNDMKKTRNLESYVEWFNRLSYLTASEIVKYPKKKQRVRIIEYWIETARECFNIGNFNSLMAIIAGLNLAPISRLKKTWAKVQSAKFSVLEHQMDPTSNFNSYRSTLKAAMWRSEGATDERERIIIPFFSLFVKDLYFLNESCSNRLPNNHINFEKCSQLAKQVMEFNEWKKVGCPYEKLPHIIAFLQQTSVLNENTLSMASFECEPPENNEEKGRYKTVKAETKQQLLQQLQEQQLQQQQ